MDGVMTMPVTFIADIAGAAEVDAGAHCMGVQVDGSGLLDITTSASASL